MAITNTSRPNSTLSNASRINIGETWNSITSTWATESRTWNAMASIIGNISKQSSNITNQTRPA